MFETPSSDWTELGELLDKLRSEMTRTFIGALFRAARLDGAFRMWYVVALDTHPVYGPVCEFEILAEEVLDYRFAPDHLLILGASRFELLSEDELLSKKHFDTCDTDRWDSTEDPRLYRILRNGENYVIAKQFWGRPLSNPGL